MGKITGDHCNIRSVHFTFSFLLSLCVCVWQLSIFSHKSLVESLFLLTANGPNCWCLQGEMLVTDNEVSKWLKVSGEKSDVFTLPGSFFKLYWLSLFFFYLIFVNEKNLEKLKGTPPLDSRFFFPLDSVLKY